MSVEFVEPDRHGGTTAASTPADPAVLARVAPPRRAAWAGRWTAVVWFAGAVLLVVAPFLTDHERRQTAFIQDFDGTHPQITRQLFDGFGRLMSDQIPDRSPLVAAGATGATAYGIVWLAAAAGLLLAAAVSLWRPAGWTTALAVAFAAAAGGGLATEQLSLAATGFAVPNQRTDVIPGAGYWTAVAGAAVVLAGATVITLGPFLARGVASAYRRQGVRSGRRPRPAR